MPMITIIAPFPGLGQLAEEVVQEHAVEWDNRVNVMVGDLNEGLSKALEAVRAGTEVIISRGGTACLIAAQLDVPVVEIDVTALDVLRALRQVLGVDGAVGLVGFKNVCYGFAGLGDILGLTIREIIIEDESRAEEKIVAALGEGIRVIVGDAVSVRIALRLGLEGCLIQSGRETVFKAVQQAFKIAEVRKREQERAALLKAVIDGSNDAMLAINSEGILTMINSNAEDLFGVQAPAVIGKRLADVVPGLAMQNLIGSNTLNYDVFSQGERTLALQCRPITIRGDHVGTVAIFQNVGQLQKYEQIVRQKLHKNGLFAKATIDDIIGDSKLIKAVKANAMKCARTDSNVLITGETGVGKEMLAQSIHNLSRRKAGPFVAVNCAALPESLLESELFGYVEGAFTGARRGGKSGLFELAHGGTLFLDEIGEMPLTLQARLLRVLQEREVMRLGGNSVIRINVRIVAATNRNLTELIDNKVFREDLYYRINVLHLNIPPLRDRPNDIQLLAGYLLKRICNNRTVRITVPALHALSCYSWPGNVRELANVVERAVLQAEDGCIDECHICSLLESVKADRCRAADPITLNEIELQTIEKVLREEGYQMTRSAEKLGISRSTLWRKLKSLDRKQ